MNGIEEKINEIFLKYTGIDFISHSELQNKKLLGAELAVPPRTLAYIYCKMEEELHLKISQDAVIDGRFDTFCNICESVK